MWHTHPCVYGSGEPRLAHVHACEGIEGVTMCSCTRGTGLSGGHMDVCTQGPSLLSHQRPQAESHCRGADHSRQAFAGSPGRGYMEWGDTLLCPQAPYISGLSPEPLLTASPWGLIFPSSHSGYQELPEWVRVALPGPWWALSCPLSLLGPSRLIPGPRADLQ